MKRRNIEIINYAGLPRRSAEAIMNLDVLLDGAFAGVPEQEQTTLKCLECLDDIQTLLAPDHATQEDSPFVQAYCQKRWLGTGLIANLQNVSRLPAQMIGNTGTFIVFRTPHPDEAALACSILGAPKEMIPVVQSLPYRHYLCRSEGFESFVHGITPTLRTGPPPTQQEIDTHMKPVFDDLAARAELSPPFDDGASAIPYGDDDENLRESGTDTPVTAEGLLDEQVAFLQMVARSELSTAELYQALAISAGTGNKIKNYLVKAGLIVAEKRKSGLGRPRLVWTLTPAGKEFARDFRS